MMIRGDRLTIEIEKAVAGGRMLGRHEGAVVLVAGTMPGETVEVEIEKVQRGTIWATATRVVKPSPDRIEPFCGLACGGMVYAHVKYERQLDLKRDILRDAFLRLGHITLPADVAIAASNPEGYRMRARLHVRDGRVGFFNEGTHELCDAASTRQLTADTAATIARLETALHDTAQAGVVEIEISENREGSERVCHLEFGAHGDPSRLAAATAIEGLTGATCGAVQHSRSTTLWGSPLVTDSLGGATLTRHGRAFFQGNRFLLEPLVSRVLEAIPAGPMLDLYAGVGLFSAPAAARGDVQVVAVEGEAVAAEDLKRNLTVFGRTATACHDSVEAFFASRRARQPFGTILVDPPRTGLSKDALQGIVRLKPARIVYVSCDVATLARDLRALVTAGYQMASVELFDIFPNTAHLETLAIGVRR